MPRWLLPESIADVLPSEARAIEELRRRLLDVYRSYGYELVMPPLIEHLEALLTGSGQDLGHRTFQLIDQLSGRTLGLRPDMTPQVARIDAHLLNRRGVARLCYAGSVLHARPSGLMATREPLQVGAELFGHAGLEADVEVIELMIESLAMAGVSRVRVDLCHVGLVPALTQQVDGLDQDLLHRLLQSKDAPGLQEALSGASPGLRDALLALTRLYGQAGGPDGVLARARRELPASPDVTAALDCLDSLVGSSLWKRHPEVELSIDLADLRGYRYHTGITFAAYVGGMPNAVGRGGRYDDIGRAFGRARPATGFSLELRELASLQVAAAPTTAILAPWSDDAALAECVAGLRSRGEIVVQMLPGHEHEQQEFNCDRELFWSNGVWALRPLA